MTARRWFAAGLALMALFAAGHFAGFLTAAYAARHDPRLVGLTRAMMAHRVSLLGFEPSILDFREYFSAAFSLLLALAVALGRTALATTTDAGSMVRALSPIYVVAFLVLAIASSIFSVVQGLVSSLLIAAVFVAARRAPCGRPEGTGAAS